MTEADYARKLDELDRLLNDPAVPLNAAMVWSLLSEITRHAADSAKEGGVPDQLLTRARKSSMRTAA